MIFTQAATSPALWQPVMYVSSWEFQLCFPGHGEELSIHGVDLIIPLVCKTNAKLLQGICNYELKGKMLLLVITSCQTVIGGVWEESSRDGIFYLDF